MPLLSTALLRHARTLLADAPITAVEYSCDWLSANGLPGQRATIQCWYNAPVINFEHDQCMHEVDETGAQRLVEHLHAITGGKRPSITAFVVLANTEPAGEKAVCDHPAFTSMARLVTGVFFECVHGSMYRQGLKNGVDWNPTGPGSADSPLPENTPFTFIGHPEWPTGSFRSLPSELDR